MSDGTKLKRIYVRISTNKINSECCDHVDVYEDATEAEIEEIARDVAFNMIEWNWSEEESK